MEQCILIGLDLGTQSVHALAAAADGRVLAEAGRKYETINAARDPWKEQDANQWESAAFEALQEVAKDLTDTEHLQVYLAVDGTSGTVLPIDRDGKPLRTALMYNDSRAKEEAKLVHQVCAPLEEKLGYRMGTSYGLPKILWMKNNQPEIYAKTAAMVHQADFLVGRLTGEYQVTDYSNALKTGYDLLDEQWPEALLQELGVDQKLLPRVVRPGQRIAPITKEAAARTGLPLQTVVVAGATDGYASCVASGAVNPGEYNTTIGTTMVLKGVTRSFIKDPQGRIYSHKHPEGYWYPGGAGNVGGLCLNKEFGAENFDALNKTVSSVTPTGNLIYPLTTRGERFPFVAPEAERFEILKNDSVEARYAGTMEGVAYVERLCYDTLEQLGCEVGGEIIIAGGAVRSPQWSQIRADVLGKRLKEPEIVEAAFGCAILAGTVELGRSLQESAAKMVRYVRTFTPDEGRHAVYNDLYAAFCDQCRKRGYV